MSEETPKGPEAVKVRSPNGGQIKGSDRRPAPKKKAKKSKAGASSTPQKSYDTAKRTSDGPSRPRMDDRSGPSLASSGRTPRRPSCEHTFDQRGIRTGTDDRSKTDSQDSLHPPFCATSSQRPSWMQQPAKLQGRCSLRSAGGAVTDCAEHPVATLTFEHVAMAARTLAAARGPGPAAAAAVRRDRAEGRVRPPHLPRVPRHQVRPRRDPHGQG